MSIRINGVLETGASGLKENLKAHGTLTGSWNETFSAAYSLHTATTGVDGTITLTGFSSTRNSISIKLTISGGTPTITLSGGTPTIAVDSPRTLSAMASGIYNVEGVSFDSGTTSEWFIGRVS